MGVCGSGTVPLLDRDSPPPPFPPYVSTQIEEEKQAICRAPPVPKRKLMRSPRIETSHLPFVKGPTDAKAVVKKQTHRVVPTVHSHRELGRRAPLASSHFRVPKKKLKRSPRVGHTRIETSQLPFVKGPTYAKAVVLKKLNINVRIVGLFSETTKVMVFHNPNSRDVEGELQFPLPDNAVVSGYGLDVGGLMVEGVIVEKKEARRILEAEKRKGADPGLVEMAKGNVYRTRVYPILAGKTRIVSVTYTVPLNADGVGRASFHVPLAHCSGVDDVSLRVDLCQTPVTPLLSGGFPTLKLAQKADNTLSCRGKLAKGMRVDDLVIVFEKLPPAFVSMERCGDDLFFNAVCTKEAESKSDSDEIWELESLGVVWDASGSRKHVVEDLKLLRMLLSGPREYKNELFSRCPLV